MRHLPCGSLFVSIAALLLVPPASAHGQFAAELRGGGSIGNYGRAHSGLETAPGPALFAAVEYRAHRAASLYGGYSRAEFGCVDGLCREQDISIVSSGFSGGVRVHPSGLPWVRGGIVMHGLNIEADGETEQVDPAIGYEIGAGFSIPISRHIAILPGLIYRRVGGDDNTTIVGADLGVQFRM